MPRHLSDKNIKAICELLDGWRDPLTWESLVNGVEGLLGHRYTRQALYTHERIRLAYSIKKNILKYRPEDAPQGSTETRAAHERISRLSAENTRLRTENERLLGQFVVWVYNASLHGLDKDKLNRALPNTDRERTKMQLARLPEGNRNG